MSLHFKALSLCFGWLTTCPRYLMIDSCWVMQWSIVSPFFLALDSILDAITDGRVYIHTLAILYLALLS